MFPAISFFISGNKEKILSIDQWGDNQWATMESTFTGCINLQSNFIDAPDLSNVNSFLNIFRDCQVCNTNIGNWNVSNLLWMSSAFQGCEAFNQNINNWVVDNVTVMGGMFQ